MVPAIARYLRFRWSLWWMARLLPLRVRDRSLSEVLQLLKAGPSKPYRGLPVEHILRCVVRTARRPIFMRDRRCLREGLLAFRFLEAAGYTPELHFGVDTTTLATADLKAHCWIVCGQQAVLNPPGANMKPILVYRGGIAAAPIPRDLAGAAFD